MKSAPGAIGAAVVAGAGEPVTGAAADLDADGTNEAVVLTCRTRSKSGQPMGGEVVITRLQGAEQRVVWRHRNLNPWKVQVGDVEGDGRPEVVVGVYKKSPRDPVMAKRVFVYDWNSKRLAPKWLGSRLSRRFDDFALFDINKDGRDELVALEVAPQGKHRIALYRWHSFGFDWVCCSYDVKADKIDGLGSKILHLGDSRRVTYRDGKITVE